MAMQIIEPTVFTKEFLGMDFGPEHHLLSRLDHGHDHPSLSYLPIVPIPGFDTKVLESIDHYCRTGGAKLFRSIPNMFDDWCFLPKSCGWDDVVIKHSSSLNYLTRTGSLEYRCEENSDQTLTDLILKLFPEWWSSFFSIKISRLRPGGWVNPHRDIHREHFNLCNFWMPLHDFDKGMKVFPLGWLVHKVGTMYLFNQYRYPHCVINSAYRDRLVICGKFHQDKIPEEVVNSFRMHKNQYPDCWI